MSLLPGQILPPSVPFGRVNDRGELIIEKNWWLLLYNLCNNALGQSGGLPASALQELAAADSDAADADAIALRAQIAALAQALPTEGDPVPNLSDVRNALLLAQLALNAVEQVVNQSVDSNSSPKFLAVQVGSTLKTTPVAGFLESDGDLFYLTDAALFRATIERTLFTQTASVTVANTVTETTLIGTGKGSVTLPANYGQIGKTLLLEGFGYHSAGGNPTIRIRIYKGTTLLLDTTAVTSGNNTNNLVQFRAQITWRSTTSVFAQGFYQESGGGSNNFEMVTTAATTVATTSEALNITATWGTAAAGNTITLTNLTVRECN